MDPAQTQTPAMVRRRRGRLRHRMGGHAQRRDGMPGYARSDHRFAQGTDAMTSGPCHARRRPAERSAESPLVPGSVDHQTRKETDMSEEAKVKMYTAAELQAV